MSDKTSKLHVFVGKFTSREDACQHTEEQWEPEPDDSATDEEYAAWEDRNPIWPPSDELGFWLDHDYIETIDGDDRYDYLNSYLTNPDDLARVHDALPGANILVLVFPDAVSEGKPAQMKSTSRLRYCGTFQFRWPR